MPTETKEKIDQEFNLLLESIISKLSTSDLRRLRDLRKAVYDALEEEEEGKLLLPKEPKDFWDRLIDPAIPASDVEISLEGFNESQLNKLLDSSISNLKTIKATIHKLCSEYSRSDMIKAGFLARVDALLKEADKIEGCLKHSEKVG